jgi:hypothetical protein
MSGEDDRGVSRRVRQALVKIETGGIGDVVPGHFGPTGEGGVHLEPERLSAVRIRAVEGDLEGAFLVPRVLAPGVVPLVEVLPDAPALGPRVVGLVRGEGQHPRTSDARAVSRTTNGVLPRWPSSVENTARKTQDVQSSGTGSVQDTGWSQLMSPVSVAASGTGRGLPWSEGPTATCLPPDPS